MREIITNNLNKMKLYRTQFRETFGVRLSDYFHTLLGLDIIALDDYLQTPEDMSMEDYINQEYGEEASKMVKELL